MCYHHNNKNLRALITISKISRSRRVDLKKAQLHNSGYKGRAKKNGVNIQIVAYVRAAFITTLYCRSCAYFRFLSPRLPVPFTPSPSHRNYVRYLARFSIFVIMTDDVMMLGCLRAIYI